MGFSFSFYNYLLFFFLIVPCFSSSCPHTLPCNKSIEIKPPFFLPNQTNHSCNSYIKMACVNNIPTLYPFNGSNIGYKLEHIWYENHTLIIQDANVTNLLINSSCGSFDLILSPFIFNSTNYDYLNKALSSYNCGQTNGTSMFGHHQNISGDCFNPKNASFEWILSFNTTGDGLSLLSTRYSTNMSCLGDKSPSCKNLRCRATRSRLKKILIVGSTTIGAFALILACTIFIIKFELLLKFIWKYNNQERMEIIIENNGTLAPKKYKYTELKKITNSFRDKLGRGGFGTVYKGIQQDGNLVAVKILHNSKSSGEDFINEVISISRTSHVNIVNLLGFCIEGSKQALVYEYMSNSSLDKYIHCENPKASLGWEKLYEIAIGIARGLEYLHSGCNTHIVHFDIKPQNILLDGDFCPKIADFGLAKLCPPKESILSRVDMRGTIGFIAPEVFSRSIGVVSTKSDVYSFGMFILEMVGGRRNAKMSVQNSSQVYFPHWIYDHIVEKGEIQVCDVTNEIEEIARKMVLVGLWCTQTIPANRPSMSRVVEMLERSVDELEMPPKPYSNSPSRSPILLSSYSSSQF